MSPSENCIRGNDMVLKAPAKKVSSGAGAWMKVAKFFAPIIVLVLIWELAVRSGWVAANILPSPSMIFSRTVFLLFSNGPGRGMLLHDILVSLYRALSAFALSSLVAIPLGFVLGLNATAYKWISPLLSVLLPLPAVAWTPILLVAFGQGDKTIIIVCFLGAFFPILYSTIQGVRSIGKQSVWVIQSMGGNSWHVFFNVLLPASLPALISGLKLGMAHSWRTLVAAEMLAAMGAGLGYMIFAARTYMDITTMFVGIGCLAIIGMIMEYGLFGSLEVATVRKWQGTSKVGGGK